MTTFTKEPLRKDQPRRRDQKFHPNVVTIQRFYCTKISIMHVHDNFYFLECDSAGAIALLFPLHALCSKGQVLLGKLEGVVEVCLRILQIGAGPGTPVKTGREAPEHFLSRPSNNGYGGQRVGSWVRAIMNGKVKSETSTWSFVQFNITKDKDTWVQWKSQ